MGTIAFMATESTSVTADPLDIVIRSETGSAISLPVIQPECFGYSQTYNVPFTVGGTSVAPTIVDAAPSEYGVSVTVAQRGYLPKSMSKRSWFRVYSSDIRPLTDGAFAITFRQKDASGNVVTVLNATVPKVGLSAIECLAVCFQQIVPQLTETSLLPGASTGYTQDPPVVDGGGSFIRAGNRSEYLYLPHTVPDSVWEVLYTESADFLSRFSSPTYEPGWYGSGTGQNAVFTITLTKIDTVGYYSLEKTMLRIGGYPPVVDSIQGNDLDFAADTIATLYRGYAGNGGGATIAAPSAGQRSITVNWPATSNITNGLYTPGGPSKFITWKAQKSLGAGSGVSKLYGFRVTYGERVLDAAIPALPWPVSGIPTSGGGGGGGSSDANTLLLLHLDEGSGATTDDASTYNSTVSATNYASGAVAGKFSGGLNLATSQLTAPHDNRFDIGNTFTIEAFLNFPALPTQNYNILVSHAQSNSWTQGWVVFFDNSGGVGLYNNGSFIFSYGIVGPGQPANLNTWFHFAITADGTTLRIFVDGQVIYTQSTPALESVVQPLCIGHDAGNTYTFAPFLIDELRISDVARYTANFTPPTAPFGIGGGTLPADVIFAVNAESNGNDVAQFGLSATASGTATIQASGSRTGDGYLRNTDGAQMADACFGYTPNAGFKAAWGAAQSMTLEFDIRVDTGAYFGGQILGIGDGSTSLTSGGATGVSLNGSPLATAAGDVDLTPDTWHHVAFVADYNGGARVIRCYRDGVEQGTGGSIGSFDFNDYPNPTTIGLLQLHAGFIGNGALKGGLDNIVLTTRAKYNANFTPPGAITGGGGSGGVVPGNVPFFFEFGTETPGQTLINRGYAGGAHLIPLTGGPSISAAPSGGYALLHAGSSTRVEDVTSSSYAPSIGTGDFTAECWLYSLDAQTDSNVGIFAMDGNDYGGRGILAKAAYGQLVWSAGQATYLLGGGPPATGAWWHVAYSRQSGVGRLFVNGAHVASGADTEPVSTGARTGPVLGVLPSSGFDESFDGYMDDFIVTLDAKYTASFTPAPRGEAFGPSNVDVTCAGYSDTDDVIGDGSFSVQATWPDAFFSAQVTLDDSTAASVFTIDGQSANFSSSRTLAAATNTGTFTAAVPMTFDGAAAADDATQTASFYADVPLEFAGDSALEDIGQISVYTFIAPAEFYGLSDVEDATSSSDYALLDPVVYMLNKAVPAATLVANTTQFYVDATVPAATLSAEISQYEGFKLSGTVPAATGRGWFGMRLNSDVPRVTIEAFGSVPNTLRMDKMLPRVTIDANIKDGRKFSLNANVPAATLSAWTGWQLAGMVPVATASGNIVVGGAFKLNSEVPVATGFGVISTMNVLRLNAVVPVATRGNWLALSCNVPAARLLARISAVQAITRVAYSFTLANSAMTRYPAYPFVQIIRMGNAYYGVADDGLYEIGGETDNGTSIPWSWETCMTDFGKAEKKTVVSAYLGGYVPQSMTYTIKAGDVPTGANAHATTATAVLRNHRQKFGIGRKSRFFAFGLSATQGRVAIESIEFEVANMSRRV